MLKVKYYNRIKQLRSINPESELPPFDIQKLQTKSWLAKCLSRAIGNPLWLLKFLRRVWPILRLGRVVVVTRADDVQEVLTNTKVFTVPFGNEMRIVSGGGDFILGMNNGAAYRAQKSLVLAAFPPDQMAEKISTLTARRAQQYGRSLAADFDPINDLFIKSAVDICEDYFGLMIANKRRFYESSIAVSSLLFADISGSRPVRELAMGGARHLLKVIDISIQKTREMSDLNTQDSPLAILVTAHVSNSTKVPLSDIRAIMMGMILGFLPTTMLAVGKALDVIFKKKQASEAILKAIADEDDQQLERCITETMRFNPIQVGPFRVAKQDYVIAAGTDRYKKIRKNSLLIPSTLSAMFDPQRVEQPEQFLPSRDKQDSMIFGYGLHSCIGAPMARAFCTQTMKTLFSLPGLTKANGRAGRIKWLGIFPNSLSMSYDQAEQYGDQRQSMLTICIPLKSVDDVPTLQNALEGLGNVAQASSNGKEQNLGDKQVADILLSNSNIHFVSGCISQAFYEEGSEVEPAHLLFELSGDGDEKILTKQFAEAIDPFIGAEIKAKGGFKITDDLSDVLINHTLHDVHPLRKNLGLMFNGSPGHSVKRIKKEAALSEKIVELIQHGGFSESLNCLDKLKLIRQELTSNQDFDWAFVPVRNRISEPPKGLLKYIWGYLKRPWSLVPTIIIVGFIVLNFQILGGVQSDWWYNLWHVGAAISMTVIGGAILISAIVFGITAYLRNLEKSDPVQFTLPEQNNYDAITSNENQIKQNHMFSVSRIKKNSLRHLLIRSILWWVKVSAGYRNTPGILSVINSIHFARWVRIPNTRQLIFFSNYGGSWESYLEDFISKASKGLTSIWSNTEGFPRTRYLYQYGAQLSEPFKHWARQQQRPTPFWYVAYPNITTSDIRKNAAIREGIAQINDVRKAEQWFSLFGSSYRPDDSLDKANIQSLVFGGMGQLPHSKLLFVSLNQEVDKTKEKNLIEYLVNNVHFGERVDVSNIWQIAFTYRGLQRLGLPNNSADSNVFANVFCQGMDSQSRVRILGDFGDNHPDNWRWGSGENKVDFVLMCYSNKKTSIETNLKELRELLSKTDSKIIHEQDCFIKPDKTEPFGFRDGVSQPIIKGTRKSYRSNQKDHLVAAGEFLCGYPDERGNIAPSPAVEIENDIFNILPKEPAQSRPNTLKDFGYNGTYLVIRQLQQHVEEFEKFCNKQAKLLQKKSNLQDASADWVGAKMIGRWKDGRPLVSYPFASQTGSAENSFRYRNEDPQGLNCPLGAHTRRANPRDSLGDDHEVQISLSNRHRLLRVGRVYETEEVSEVGLMFMCMNSDIERQFEFVQQSWINNSSFHGLMNEKDSVTTSGCPAANKYTIPTNQGAVTLNGMKSFVTTKGGSYFFMPGRQALMFFT